MGLSSAKLCIAVAGGDQIEDFIGDARRFDRLHWAKPKHQDLIANKSTSKIFDFKGLQSKALYEDFKGLQIYDLIANKIFDFKGDAELCKKI